MFDVHEGCLYELILNELVLGVGLGLFGGKEIEDVLGVEPTGVELCEFMLVDVIVLFP